MSESRQKSDFLKEKMVFILKFVIFIPMLNLSISGANFRNGGEGSAKC